MPKRPEQLNREDADDAVLIYDLLPKNHPIYHLIGRVASDWSCLEHALDSIHFPII
jgi:hypothetical protein